MRQSSFVLGIELWHVPCGPLLELSTQNHMHSYLFFQSLAARAAGFVVVWPALGVWGLKSVCNCRLGARAGARGAAVERLRETRRETGGFSSLLGNAYSIFHVDVGVTDDRTRKPYRNEVSPTGTGSGSHRTRPVFER